MKASTFCETLALVQCNIRIINPMALYDPIPVLHVTRIIYQNSKSENSEACVYKNSILLMMLTLHRRYEYNKFHSFVTLIAAVLHFPLPSLFYGLCILMPSLDGADALLKDQKYEFVSIAMTYYVATISKSGLEVIHCHIPPKLSLHQSPNLQRPAMHDA